MCDCTFKESPWRLYHQSFAFDDAFSFLCEEKNPALVETAANAVFQVFEKKSPIAKITIQLIS